MTGRKRSCDFFARSWPQISSSRNPAGAASCRAIPLLPRKSRYWLVAETRVTDPSGAVLPGVTVTAASPVLQIREMTGVSDERGSVYGDLANHECSHIAIRNTPLRL